MPVGAEGEVFLLGVGLWAETEKIEIEIKFGGERLLGVFLLCRSKEGTEETTFSHSRLLHSPIHVFTVVGFTQIR